MRVVLFLVATALAGVTAFSQQPVTVTADFPPAGESLKVEVGQGQRLVLRWKNIGSDSVLVGIGPIPAAGEQVVTPDRDFEYTIISTNGPSVEFRIVAVSLEGRKGPAGTGIGNSEFPALKDYLTENAVDVVIRGLAYPSLIDRTYVYLAETCGHAIEKTQDLSGAYTLWTNRIESAEGHPAACVDALPKGHNISTQPIATSYYLRFYKPEASGTLIEIGAMVTSRPLRSLRSLPIPDKQYARTVADSLRVRLEGVLK